MNAAPEIRRLDVTDAPALLALRRIALETEPLAFAASEEDDISLVLPSVERFLGDRAGQAVFGGIDSGDLVAMIGVVRGTKVKQRHTAMIWGTFVLPRVRGRGCGAALLDAVIRHASGWPVQQLHLGVSETALTARRLYERAGFTSWGREPRALQWQGRFVDEDHLVLDLGKAHA